MPRSTRTGELLYNPEIEREAKRLKKLAKQAKQQQLVQVSSSSLLINIEDQVHTSSDTDTEPNSPIVGHSFEDIPFENHIVMNHTPPHNPNANPINQDANTPPHQPRQQPQEPLIDMPPWNQAHPQNQPNYQPPQPQNQNFHQNNQPQNNAFQVQQVHYPNQPNYQHPQMYQNPMYPQ
ncbi:hypothetical protein Lser_V15G11556 [Lactuca serriola]